MIAGMSAGLGPFSFSANDKLLIYGIGNLGRQDDGLAIRLVEMLNQSLSQRDLRKNIVFESNYQLGIEDALLISEYDVVLFLDATREKGAITPFSVRYVETSAELSFTTHAMSIPNVLSLCEELYGKTPRAYLLAVPGYEWEIAEHLSPQADLNLDQAFRSLSLLVKKLPEEVSCTSSR